MQDSGWRLNGTRNTVLTLGGGLAGTGGLYQLTIVEREGRAHQAVYLGGGAGMGAGLNTGGGALGATIMDFVYPVVRGLVGTVASLDLTMSPIYSLRGEPLDRATFTHRMYVFAIGAELGGSFTGNLLVWEYDAPMAGISSLTARLGDFAPRTEPRWAAACLTTGFGVGMVGASGTISYCSNRSFD